MNTTYNLSEMVKDMCQTDVDRNQADDFISTSEVTPKVTTTKPTTRSATKKVIAKKTQLKKYSGLCKKPELSSDVKKLIGKVSYLPKTLKGQKVEYFALHTPYDPKSVKPISMTTIPKQTNVAIANWYKANTTFGDKYVLITPDERIKYWSNSSVTFFLDCEEITPKEYGLILTRLEDGQFTIGVFKKPKPSVTEEVGNYKDISEEDEVIDDNDVDDDIIVVEAPPIDKI